MRGHLRRALPDLARVSFAGIVAYRAEMVIWILSTLLPLVMLALWSAVAREGPVAGYDEAGFVRYFAITLVVRQLTSVWLVWALNEDIRTGRLSIWLLKPMHPLVQHAIDMVVAIPLRALVLVPIVGTLLLLRPDLWRTPSPAEVALFAVATAVAWLLNFLVQALFATLSFWIDKSDALFGVWFAAWSLLSGYLVPLSLFPPGVRPVLAALPFRGMLGLPVEILGGFLPLREAVVQVGVQAAWLVALLGAVRWVWAVGVRRYGAFGA
ncbi:MAG: ABC-2 family transporter protein [Myxococcota bacterium]